MRAPSFRQFVGRLRLVGACAVLWLCAAAGAQAQSVNEYVGPGIPSMTLYIWQPQASSIWRVARDVSVIELLSVVGVTAGDASSGANSTLTVYRQERGERRLVFAGDVRDILSSEVEVPALQDQDVLLVEARQRRRWLSVQAISTYVTTASTLLLLILNLRGL